MTSERHGPRIDGMRRRTWTLALVAATAGSAWAQSPPPPRIALISMIGDSLTIDIHRGQTGTHIQTNRRSTVPMPAPTFDLLAMTKTRRLVAAMYPGAEFEMLAVPKAGSDGDPERLLADGKPDGDNPFWKALQGRFSHAIVIGKLRVRTTIPFAQGRIDAGSLTGLGFYIDYDLTTSIVGEAAKAKGYIAPYANLRVALVDVGNLGLISERTASEAFPRSATRNKEGFDPWGAMSAEQKVEYVSELVEAGLDKAVPALFTPSK